MFRYRLRSIAALSAVVLSALAAAPAANAGPLVASASDCHASGYSLPFLRWLDPMTYIEQPGGNFESDLSGWSLAGGAAVVDGNEPYNVGGGNDSHSLSIPAGGSATSATVCVGLDHPTLRFFSRSSGSLALSSLRVDVRFEDAGGTVRTLTIGGSAPGDWLPTTAKPITANLLALLPGELTPVQFRFTAQGSANWQIDDVYVDPRRQ